MSGARAPQRFRRRLTFAFIGVGAAAAGMLAVISYLLIHDHRLSAFRQRAEDRSDLAALTIREPITEDEFEAVVDEYRVRIDAQSDPVQAEPVHLRTAVATVVSGLGGAGTVESHVPDDLYVDADRARFRRVMTNLLTNAVEHGGGRVEIDATRSGAEVRVAVRDHGPGIAAESRERIFDRFFKADTSRSRGGTGLGLLAP